MIGVFCQLAGATASGQTALSSAGTPDCRQTIDSFPAVSLLIWSSVEYFVLALSPEYAGQFWIFWSLLIAFHATPMVSAATSHQNLFFICNAPRPSACRAISCGNRHTPGTTYPKLRSS